MGKKLIKMAHHSVWDIDATGLESMPLGCSYLKAMAYKNENIRKEADIQISNFGGSTTTLKVLKEMLLSPQPNMACFSVFGWNFNLFKDAIESFRQFNKDCWVVLGGTHVSSQAERVFKLIPGADIIVNGEGEYTFVELVENFLSGTSKHELYHIKGLSFKDADGKIITTENRELIQNLDEIPSPFLTKNMELLNRNGSFKYDVALLETNRGCPYNCSFCYWGGAISQQIRFFSRDRIKEEIELFARYQVNDICLCDSNFGMNEADVEFMEILIKSREKYGYPNRVVTSWAKNKNKYFNEILNRLIETGFGTSFSMSLQTISEPVLRDMKRKNMKMEDWKETSRLLRKHNKDVYAELMWGLPNETYDSFIKGYDIVAEEVPRIALYPHIILPNTYYSVNRDEFNIVTWRGSKFDFEYVLSHNTMTFEENVAMHRFIFWARMIAEYSQFRYVWLPLLKLAGIKQSQVILSIDDWFENHDSEAARKMLECRKLVTDNLDAYRIERGLEVLFKVKEMKEIFLEWWEEKIIPLVPEHFQGFFRELFKYDWAIRPIYNTINKDRLINADTLDGHPITKIGNDLYYIQKNIKLKYNIPQNYEMIKSGNVTFLEESPISVDFYHKVGFSDYMLNHEFYEEYNGKLYEELMVEKMVDIV